MNTDKRMSADTKRYVVYALLELGLIDEEVIRLLGVQRIPIAERPSLPEGSWDFDVRNGRIFARYVELHEKVRGGIAIKEEKVLYRTLGRMRFIADAKAKIHAVVATMLSLLLPSYPPELHGYFALLSAIFPDADKDIEGYPDEDDVWEKFLADSARRDDCFIWPEVLHIFENDFIVAWRKAIRPCWLPMVATRIDHILSQLPLEDQVLLREKFGFGGSVAETDERIARDLGVRKAEIDTRLKALLTILRENPAAPELAAFLRPVPSVPQRTEAMRPPWKLMPPRKPPR